MDVPVPPRGALVAVVEDDEASRSALGRVLRAAGFEPALFASAEGFMGSWHRRAWLCLIVDVHLSGMSGIDLQRKIRNEGSDVPMIMTTGDREDRIRERAVAAGCTAFFLKPVCAERLLAILAALPNPSPA
jgi:FixJ family two-component response regulator